MPCLFKNGLAIQTVFITVTCNSKWSEIKRFLRNTTLNSKDRPGILCRLFKIKLDALIKDLKEKQLPGKVGAGMLHLCLILR